VAAGRATGDGRLCRGWKAGQHSIRINDQLRLCRFLGLKLGSWLRAQAAHDTELASADLADELEQIQPLVAAHRIAQLLGQELPQCGGRNISRIAAPDCRCCCGVPERSALLKDGVFPGYQRFPTEMGGFSPGFAGKTRFARADLGWWMGKTAVPLTPLAQASATGRRRCGSGAKVRQSCSLSRRPVLPDVGLPL
jgi:hypothetical protein